MRQNYDFKVYLGKEEDTGDKVYLEGFSWNSGWYWGGGYIETFHGRECQSLTHFDSVFLDRIEEGQSQPNIWRNLSDILDDAQFTSDEWWRIKDLYKQFYTLRNSSEVFQYGGHCTSKGRSKKEIQKNKARWINDHIEKVIIPEIIKALKVEATK